VHNLVGPIPPGYSATYRLDPREASVIYGQLPPGIASVRSVPSDWTSRPPPS